MKTVIALLLALALSCAAQTPDPQPPVNVKAVARIVHDTDSAFTGYAPKFKPRAIVFWQNVPNQRDYVIEITYLAGAHAPTQQIVHDFTCYACQNPDGDWGMVVIDIQSANVDTIKVYVLDKATTMQGQALFAK